MLEPISSLDALDEAMALAAKEGGEQARVSYLVDRYLDDPSLHPTHPDPFSSAYRDEVLAIHARISRRDNYQPERDELIDIDPSDRALRPGIYRDGDSRHLGLFLEAIGQILQVAAVPPGAKVVEFGPGDGQLIIPFARMGCEVAVIDIEEKYLDTLSRQLEMMNLTADKRLCRFGEDSGLRDYDLAVFFEAFHHALHHDRLLINLHEVLNENGRILFAGEPIIEAGTYWESIIPGHWGLRLDGLSVSQVRHQGWMELGFREGYFVEVLMRSGWLVEKKVSLSNGRGTAYVAHKAGSEIDLRKPICLHLHDREHGWHGPEAEGRWTGAEAALTLPSYPSERWNVSVEINNPFGEPTEIVVSAGDVEQRAVLPPQQRSQVSVAGAAGRLIFRTLNPTDLGPITDGVDQRVVGCYVEKVSLSAV